MALSDKPSKGCGVATMEFVRGGRLTLPTMQSEVYWGFANQRRDVVATQ